MLLTFDRVGETLDDRDEEELEYWRAEYAANAACAASCGAIKRCNRFIENSYKNHAEPRRRLCAASGNFYVLS